MLRPFLFVFNSIAELVMIHNCIPEYFLNLYKCTAQTSLDKPAQQTILRLRLVMHIQCYGSIKEQANITKA